MNGLKDKFASFKDRLNNHLEDNQNLDLANYQEEMLPMEVSPLPESLAKLKSSSDLQKPETAAVDSGQKIENRLGNIKKMIEGPLDENEETKYGGGPTLSSAKTSQQLSGFTRRRRK